MMCKRLLFVVAAGALLLLQFGDCASATQLDQQTMRCCGSMPCTPANHGQGCCKNMTSAQAPSMLAAKHASLRAPVVTGIEYPRMPDIFHPTPPPAVVIDDQQHSPPKLYALHASLLI
jgi:hypothetical protein